MSVCPSVWVNETRQRMVVCGGFLTGRGCLTWTKNCRGLRSRWRKGALLCFLWRKAGVVDGATVRCNDGGEVAAWQGVRCVSQRISAIGLAVRLWWRQIVYCAGLLVLRWRWASTTKLRYQ